MTVAAPAPPRIRQTLDVPALSIDVGDTYMHGRKRGKVARIERPYLSRYDRTHVIIAVQFPGDKTPALFRHDVTGTVTVEAEL